MTFFLLLLLAQHTPVHTLCQQCHTEAAADVESHPHFAKSVSCDACHGSSEKHRAASGHVAPDRVAVREQVPPLCGSCHPAQRKSYDASPHAASLRSGGKPVHCASCHGNHALRAVRAIESSCQRCHAALPAACSANPPRAAKLRCAGCHNPHSLSRN
jgi:hypothetical protein